MAPNTLALVREIGHSLDLHNRASICTFMEFLRWT